MALSDELAAIPSGAQFYRADLHIHSAGGSHDVRDEEMTPDRIVQTAIDEGLQVIAIADHNEIANVEPAIRAAEGKPVSVIPAVELSTPEGHLLVFFQDLEALRRYFAGLDVVDHGTQDSRCQTSMLDCLKRLEATSGFAILAHVEAEAGLEGRLEGGAPHKRDILAHPNLLGVELRDADSPVSYSVLDPDPVRAEMGRARAESLALGAGPSLARVLFSDSHTLGGLGKNARGDKRVTRIKMDAPSFRGLKLALLDADARVRIEDEIPETVPHVLGVRFEGGFLHQQAIHFSRNLTCIIGGRGAGKSTALEVVRSLTPRGSSSKLVDSEAWPERSDIAWVDAAGQIHHLIRRINEPVENADDPDLGPVDFEIESYGQGDTAETSSKAQKDPSALLTYLDQFVDIEHLLGEDEDLRGKLLENQNEIERADLEVGKIRGYERALESTKSQLAKLEAAKAKEVVALERKVAEEREIRAGIEEDSKEIIERLGDSAVEELFEGLANRADPAELRVGADQYRGIVNATETLRKKIESARKGSSDDVSEFKKEVGDQLAAWRKQEREIMDAIDAKRQELAAQDIRLDMAYIRKLASDEAKHTRELERLRRWRARRVDMEKERRGLLRQRVQVRGRIAAVRTAYARQASEALAGSLGDLVVSVKFADSALSPAAEDLISATMGWRTVQVPRSAALVRDLTVPSLLEAIRGNDTAPLTQLTSADGERIFTPADARGVIDRFKDQANRHALERCEVQDLPVITVTKRVESGERAGEIVSKDFSRLSLGQQQSVLLSLLLAADTNEPLLIDQPEDNLDGEFIYQSLVPALRRAKERRQVIVVTHNANIAVLGDAEQIVTLKSVSDKGTIVGRGSVDDPNTRDMACRVLEGSEAAFRRRAQMYGVVD